jgi:hypothetical protein
MLDQEVVDKIVNSPTFQRAPTAVLLREMPQKCFCCHPFGDRTQMNLPPPMDEQSLGGIVQLAYLNPNLPRILNRDLGAVFQHACV